MIVMFCHHALGRDDGTIITRLLVLAADHTSTKHFMEDLSREQLLLLLKERDAFVALQQEQNDAQQALIATQQEQLEKLALDLKLLKRALFGHRRERFDDPLQKMLFESEQLGDANEEVERETADDNDESNPKQRRGGKRGRIVIPEAMPRKEVVHPLREEDIPEQLRGRDDLRVFRKKVGPVRGARRSFRLCRGRVRGGAGGG